MLLAAAVSLRRWRKGAPHRAVPAALLPGSLRSRLEQVAGHEAAGGEASWAALESLAASRDPVISLAAACALLRLEPRIALEELGPAIAARTDWPLARLGSVFEALGPGAITPILTQWLLARPRTGLDRVVKLARFAERRRVASIVRGWLTGHDPEVIMAALEYVEVEEDLPWVQSAAHHEDWRVRMAAAKALARVGHHREVAALVDLLRDPVWWVRYHAAQALTRVEGVPPLELELLQDSVRDAYAKDMLGQALAGMRWR